MYAVTTTAPCTQKLGPRNVFWFEHMRYFWHYSKQSRQIITTGSWVQWNDDQRMTSRTRCYCELECRPSVYSREQLTDHHCISDCWKQVTEKGWVLAQLPYEYPQLTRRVTDSHLTKLFVHRLIHHITLLSQSSVNTTRAAHTIEVLFSTEIFK